MTRPGPTTVPRTRLRAPQRRAQLAEVAAQLFRLRGFHHVSMADVAAAVGITAPAVYRHYTDKQELLAAAIGGALDTVEATLGRVPDAPLEEFLTVLAGAAVARHELWVLLQRELRHVGAERRVPLERRFAQLARRFTAVIARDRPHLTAAEAGLLTTATLAVLASPSVYRRETTGARQQAVLSAAAIAAARARWKRRPDEGPTSPTPSPAVSPAATRSDQLLDAAVRLFATGSYQSVSLDDIGAELGMAGPSTYHWYATKADLLVAAFSRATDRLTAQHGPAARTRDLDELVASYVDLGIHERLLFSVYVLEAKNLPPEAGRRVRHALDADVAAWVAALTLARPDLPPDQGPVLVHAARAVVQDVVRLGRWHERADTPAALRAVVHAVLDSPAVG